MVDGGSEALTAPYRAVGEATGAAVADTTVLDSYVEAEAGDLVLWVDCWCPARMPPSPATACGHAVGRWCLATMDRP